MGERGPMPGNAFGAAAVANAIKGADFPMSKQDLLQKYGNKEIEYRVGEYMKLSDVIGDMPDETFNSAADLEHAFHQKFSKG